MCQSVAGRLAASSCGRAAHLHTPHVILARKYVTTPHARLHEAQHLIFERRTNMRQERVREEGGKAGSIGPCVGMFGRGVGTYISIMVIHFVKLSW